MLIASDSGRQMPRRTIDIDLAKDPVRFDGFGEASDEARFPEGYVSGLHAHSVALGNRLVDRIEIGDHAAYAPR